MISRDRKRTRTTTAKFLSPIMIVLLMVAGIVLPSGDLKTVEAQSFSSGSNGSDGALNLNTPGTILFDPRSFPTPLDPDGDNVYHFTTINIAAGVTVKLSGKIFSGPVFWLATGAVQIAGTIDLSGDAGNPVTTIPAVRVPSTPGAGGYGGGVGNRSNLTAAPGNGPGGGAPGNGSDGRGRSGTFTGNQFLVPLIGGSGGGGGTTPSGSTYQGGGGGGGGALLIASSTSIALTGSILADGGAAGEVNNAGGGSGGGIRLVAPLISGNGLLRTASGPSNVTLASVGKVRLEAFTDNFNGSFNNTTFTRASPVSTFLPSPTSVRVVSIAGIPVPPNPMGSFTLPDVTVNQTVAVPVAIEARNIPLGTVVKLHFFSENGADQLVDASPLAGTLTQSTATAQVTFPSGFTRGFVRATWTQ